MKTKELESLKKTNPELLPAPDYWMSIQHGKFKVSYTDDSDSAYKWFPVWTRPLVSVSELDRNAVIAEVAEEFDRRSPAELSEGEAYRRILALRDRTAG